ncbi:hypothetical protein [Streptomyces mobaraensis]|uniref:hypothetical protein n=1 Tax=Streptomyces mobaraensis TaxID=35621 RepID=UPI001FA76FEE|nr:hypothetical protein [Streptomyces mobaraensis]
MTVQSAPDRESGAASRHPTLSIRSGSKARTSARIVTENPVPGMAIASTCHVDLRTRRSPPFSSPRLGFARHRMLQ